MRFIPITYFKHIHPKASSKYEFIYCKDCLGVPSASCIKDCYEMDKLSYPLWLRPTSSRFYDNYSIYLMERNMKRNDISKE